MGEFHVIIVGGSIAGLTLAHCLHHLNISYTVLEAYSELAPDAGASIALLPNGTRILDQLGMHDAVCAVSAPISRTKFWDANGKSLIDGNGPELIEKRHGYPLLVLRRRDLLKVLAEHIPASEKDQIKTSKRVVKIEHLEDGVVAHCSDGSIYRGDIIVGADGIHSTVRKCMQDHIDRLYPGKTQKDRKGLSAEYNCIFGIGAPIPGVVEPGDSYRTFDSDRSTLSFVGNDGQLYWFLVSKLDRRYFGDEIPRYRLADAEEKAKDFFKLTFDGISTYEDVWATKSMPQMVCIEELQCENWTEGRFVCIGDSVHKVILSHL
jgi:2-polyprenyl-6-methoxyphenol hydroxylase-like FAD-dependent oxidoreductase